MPDGIDAFNQSPGIGVQCGDCGAHFLIDPAGEIKNTTCDSCGGKRFFRTQPSPVKDDLSGENILKNMPDAGGGMDTGGNPLGEGTIVASIPEILASGSGNPGLGSKGPIKAIETWQGPDVTPPAPTQGPTTPAYSTPLITPYDEYLRQLRESNIQAPGLGVTNGFGTGCPNCGAEAIDGYPCPACGTLAPNSNASNPDLARGIAGAPLTEGTIVGEDGVPSDSASTHGYDGYTHSHVAGRFPNENPDPSIMYPSDTMSGVGLCPNCAGQDDPTCPYCQGQGNILFPNPGSDGGNSPSHIDHTDATHLPFVDIPHVFGPVHQGNTMNMEFPNRDTISMEPYPSLWSDEIVKEANFWDSLWNGAKSVFTNPIVDAAGATGLAALQLGLNPAADAGAAALDAGAIGDAAAGGGVMNAIRGGLGQAAPTLMRQLGKGALQGFGEGAVKGLAGGGAPGASGMSTVTAPAMQQLGSTDIPMMLVADFYDHNGQPADDPLGDRNQPMINPNFAYMDVPDDGFMTQPNRVHPNADPRELANMKGLAIQPSLKHPEVDQFGLPNNDWWAQGENVGIPNDPRMSAHLADLETPNSVKSVDEQHDDPEEQDQKEFDDGDKSPSNFHNPNNEDSGASGEDGVRDATPGYGFGPNSPAIKHMEGILPLILHYITNGLTADDDPIIDDLHNKLESEQPGYLNHEHPDGPKIVELMIQNHNTKKSGIIPPVPMPASSLGNLGEYGTDTVPIQQKPQHCPVCGSTINGDGSCPHCDFPAAGTGMPQSQAPQQVTANTFGEIQNNQQRQAILDYLDQHPEDSNLSIEEVLQKIQNNPNPVPKFVQPQPAPAPMGGMEQAPGAMPVMDPSQPGGGGGQPMQPMASFHNSALGDVFPDNYAEQQGYQTCKQCGKPLDIKAVMANKGLCMNCLTGKTANMNLLYQIAELRQSLPPDVQHKIDDLLGHYGPQAALQFLQQLTGKGPQSGGSIGVPIDTLTQTLYSSKHADANNMVKRCPSCQSATTSIVDGNDGEVSKKQGYCHSCHKVFPLTEKSAMVALANPLLDPQAIWSDSNGNPIQEGDQYLLYTAGMPVPDEVTVLAKKPGELQLQLVGTNADFRVQSKDVQTGKYSFEPATNSAAYNNEVPNAQHPLDNANVIQEPTTDQITDQYPNGPATTSHVHEDDEKCPNPKCGSYDTYEVMSSPQTVMHECYRCASVWETSLEDDHDYGDYGREYHNSKLDWLKGGDDDDFFAEYERHRAGMGGAGNTEYASGSRNIHEIASRDPRLAEIRERLDANESVMEHIAGKHFTQAEKRELIDEHGHARNYGQLDLSNTHYKVDDEYIARRKGNGMDVPDSHLILGL